MPRFLVKAMVASIALKVINLPVAMMLISYKILLKVPANKNAVKTRIM